MATNPVHNSKFDIITWGGTSFSGAQHENYITVTPREDLIESTIDASGGVSSLTVKNDMRADVTIRLSRQSPINAALADIVRHQRNTGEVVVDSISFADSNTLHIYELNDCFIMRLPDEETSTSADNMYEWQFECGRCEPKQVDDFTFTASITANLQSAIDLTLDAIVTL